ncbi:MAG: DUF2939 domain-containing protein [Pseudomonadota bacterium]
MASSKTRVAAFAATALIIAAGALWYFESPVWTLHQMKAAADANDPDALSSYIDYPALRQDLKTEIRGQMMAEATKDRSAFGRLGLAIGTELTAPVIDRLVTPAGMRAAHTAKRVEAQTRAAAQPASALRVPDDPVIVRRGFSEFLVASKRQPKSGLLFKRHGLSWKLSGVDLPPNG